MTPAACNKYCEYCDKPPGRQTEDISKSDMFYCTLYIHNSKCFERTRPIKSLANGPPYFTTIIRLLPACDIRHKLPNRAFIGLGVINLDTTGNSLDI